MATFLLFRRGSSNILKLQVFQLPEVYFSCANHRPFVQEGRTTTTTTTTCSQFTMPVVKPFTDCPWTADNNAQGLCPAAYYQIPLQPQ
jgi:hypothetical protein